jgi:hypothetical protein
VKDPAHSSRQKHGQATITANRGHLKRFKTGSLEQFRFFSRGNQDKSSKTLTNMLFSISSRMARP